jgi:hypothetical protein
MRFRTAADKALATIYLAAGRKVGLRNDIASVAKASSTVLATGRWYDIELHAIVNGAASTIEVRVDGVKLTDISTSPSDLGTAGIGSLQIGENNIGSAYDALYDDVVATRAVGPGTTAALRTAPRCTSGSSVRLSGPRRQHVARTGAVQIQALSASTCQVHAVAMVRSVRGRALVQSHSVTTVLPAGRRGALTLLFSPRGRQRIKRELGRRPVYVLVYAGSRTRPIAKRRVLATP